MALEHVPKPLKLPNTMVKLVHRHRGSSREAYQHDQYRQTELTAAKSNQPTDTADDKRC
jgi:hypothetical protein